MKKLATATAALAAAATIGITAPATADSATKTVSTGSYTAITNSFSCIRQVHDDGYGGILSLKTSANELRLEDRHFRVARAATHVVAQERSYSGRWVNVKRSRVKWGSLGRTIDEGAYNRSWVNYGGSAPPPQ
jgi:uncharacterized low-complexity protein